MTDMLEMEFEMVDIGQIEQHPQNPNNGDLDLLEESIEVNGFAFPIVVQRSSQFILAGNHRFLAAHKFGFHQVPVIWLDIDDEHAIRLMLADNQITRKGFDDEAQLLNLMQELQNTDIGLHGTGFGMREMLALQEEFGAPAQLAPDVPDSRLDGAGSHPDAGLRWTVIPIKDELGNVYGLELTKIGNGLVTAVDAQSIRKALGLGPFAPEELEAFQVRDW